MNYRREHADEALGPVRPDAPATIWPSHGVDAFRLSRRGAADKATGRTQVKFDRSHFSTEFAVERTNAYASGRWRATPPMKAMRERHDRPQSRRIEETASSITTLRLRTARQPVGRKKKKAGANRPLLRVPDPAQPLAAGGQRPEKGQAWHQGAGCGRWRRFEGAELRRASSATSSRSANAEQAE